MIESLLAHREWLHRLAAHLVRDTSVADDLVQETWAAALRSPPDPNRPPRPWLAEVLRNLVRMRARGQTRARAAFATDAVDAASPPSTDAILEQLEAQRMVADLLAKLEEPYRTVLLLRYHEGREPSQIARDLQLPAGTVRWRIKEGLDRLRARLDARVGSRRTWILMVAPWARERGPWWKGAIVMSKTKVALIVAAGGLVALGTAVRVQSAGKEANTSVPAEVTKAATPAVDQPSPSVSPAPAGRPLPPKFVPAVAAHPILDKESIRTAIMEVVPQIKQCYDRHLSSHPEAQGRVVVEFTIRRHGDEGRITDATIVPDERDGGVAELKAPLVEQCILNSLAEQTFPAPQGSGVTVVRYPLTMLRPPRPDASAH